MTDQSSTPETASEAAVADAKPAVKATPKPVAKTAPKKPAAAKKAAPAKPKAKPSAAKKPIAAKKPADHLDVTAEKGLDLVKQGLSGSQDILLHLVKANTVYWTRRVEITKTLSETESPEAFLEVQQGYFQAQIEDLTKAGREAFEMASKTTNTVLEDLQRITR